MKIHIRQTGGLARSIEVERLVSTIGFGDGCDIVLGDSPHTERLGMIIQQGDGFSFRPLNDPSGVRLNGTEMASMSEWPRGAVIGIDTFEITWGDEPVLSSPPSTSTPPSSQNSPPPGMSAYRAGAMSAYGGGESSSPPPKANIEGVDLQLSGQSPPASMGPAEAKLAEKLNRVGQEHQSPPPAPESDSDSFSSADELIQPWSPPQEKGKVKDVFKFFFNHLDRSVFLLNAPERKLAMHTLLEEAMREVRQEDRSSPLFSKLEQELKSPASLRKLLDDPAVTGLMIRDQGVVYVDRGEGYGSPEFSFFNVNHAYWTLDRLLLSMGVKMSWGGGHRSFVLDQAWGGRLLFPRADWQGSYIMMSRRQTDRLNLKAEPQQISALQNCLTSGENILLVASSEDEARELSYWLLGVVEDIGSVLILTHHDHAGVSEHPRRITICREGDPLTSWLEWSIDMKLCGVLNVEPLQRDFSLVRELSLQNRRWWQMVHARNPQSGMEKLELDLLLENPEVSPELMRRCLAGTFHTLLGIGPATISGKHRQVVLGRPVLSEEGSWKIEPMESEGDSPSED
jgi:hypothetical protein